MTDPGWYDDYEEPARLRWYDGAAWTEHVSPKPSGAADATPPVAGAAAPEADPAASRVGKPASTGSMIASMLFLGVFFGLVLGGCIFNGAGAITPVTVEQATLEDIEFDISTGSNQGTSPRRTYTISGTTESGREWRIVSQDAYEIVEREGWPQPVEVAIGDWTDTAERVTGASFEVDHQTTAARLGWGAAIVVLALAGITATVMMARRSPGALGAAIFAVAYFVPGVWLGYIGTQWIQSP